MLPQHRSQWSQSTLLCRYSRRLLQEYPVCKVPESAVVAGHIAIGERSRIADGTWVVPIAPVRAVAVSDMATVVELTTESTSAVVAVTVSCSDMAWVVPANDELAGVAASSDVASSAVVSSTGATSAVPAANGRCIGGYGGFRDGGCRAGRGDSLGWVTATNQE
ncbi:MAG: hypothetical protein R2932_39985 [Caldilineaceae bacterium]